MNAKIHQQLANRKSRIERRLDKKRLGDASRPAFTVSNIHYEIADRSRGIAHGGIGVFHLLAQRIGLIEAIDQNLHLLVIHMPYHESDHVLNLAYNALCDGTCLQDSSFRDYPMRPQWSRKLALWHESDYCRIRGLAGLSLESSGANVLEMRFLQIGAQSPLQKAWASSMLPAGSAGLDGRNGNKNEIRPLAVLAERCTQGQIVTLSTKPFLLATPIARP